MHGFQTKHLHGLHYSLFTGPHFAENKLSVTKRGWGKIDLLEKFVYGLASHCYWLETFFGMSTPHLRTNASKLHILKG